MLRGCRRVRSQPMAGAPFDEMLTTKLTVAPRMLLTALEQTDRHALPSEFLVLTRSVAHCGNRRRLSKIVCWQPTRSLCLLVFLQMPGRPGKSDIGPGYQMQNRGTNRGTILSLKTLSLLFIRVSRLLSIDASPYPLTKAARNIHLVAFFHSTIRARADLICPRCDLPSSRRRVDARVGFVALRKVGTVLAD